MLDKQLVPNTQSQNAKQTLVLIPGWGADQSTWTELLPYFSDDFELRFIDLHSLNDQAQTLTDLVAKLADLIPDQSHVLAWSLGGMLATRIAADYPNKVSKLITLASNVSFVENASWSTAMPQETFSQFFQDYCAKPVKTARRFNALQVQGDSNAKSLLKTVQARSVLLSDDANTDFACRLLEYLSELDGRCIFELQQPCLSLFAEHDSLVPHSAALAMQAQAANILKTSRLNVKVVKGAGHAFHISHAELVAHEAYRFLGRTEPRFRKDKQRIADSFSKAARRYDDYAGLQYRVANKLCLWSSELSGRVLDLGCGTGYCSEILAQREGVDSICAFDIAPHMLFAAREKLMNVAVRPTLYWCNGDAENLPFNTARFDWIVSSLVVQWCDELQSTFNEAARCLDKNGRFLLSSLGPETLKELNKAWQVADPAHVHVNNFLEAEAVMAIAKRAGFEVELFALDYEVLNYKKVTELMRELKGIGAHNVNQGGNPGLTGKAMLEELTTAYEHFRLASGELPASYQVYYWQFLKK